MDVLLFVLIVLFVFGVGTGPYMPYSRSWGWGPSGLVWVFFVFALIVLLSGRF